MLQDVQQFVEDAQAAIADLQATIEDVKVRGLKALVALGDKAQEALDAYEDGEPAPEQQPS